MIKKETEVVEILPHQKSEMKGRNRISFRWWTEIVKNLSLDSLKKIRPLAKKYTKLEHVIVKWHNLC